MYKRTLVLFILLFMLMWLSVPSYVYSLGSQPSDSPLGGGFTYQGFLQDAGGDPIQDTCDLRFSLWDAPKSGAQIGEDSLISGVTVVHGHFDVEVNANTEFGNQPFEDLEDRFLQVEVRCSGDTVFTPLDPRQSLEELKSFGEQGLYLPFELTGQIAYQGNAFISISGGALSLLETGQSAAESPGRSE